MMNKEKSNNGIQNKEKNISLAKSKKQKLN